MGDVVSRVLQGLAMFRLSAKQGGELPAGGGKMKIDDELVTPVASFGQIRRVGV